MGLSVRIGAGTGVESLVTAAAVADADWRSVFTHGETAWSAARSAGGAALTGQVGRFGRFGWINLVGLLTARRPPGGPRRRPRGLAVGEHRAPVGVGDRCRPDQGLHAGAGPDPHAESHGLILPERDRCQRRWSSQAAVSASRTASRSPRRVSASTFW